MALAFDGSAVTAIGTPFTPTLTVPSIVIGSGANRLLVVGYAYKNDTTEASATFNGSSTGIVKFQGTSPVFSGIRINVFYLIAPANVTADFVITSGQSDFTPSGFARAFTGADQTAPLARWASATGSSTTPSVSVTGVVAGEWSFDVMGGHGTGYVPGASQTANITPVTIAGSGEIASTRDETSTGTVVQSLSGALDDWVIGGFVIVPAASGPRFILGTH